MLDNHVIINENKSHLIYKEASHIIVLLNRNWIFNLFQDYWESFNIEEALFISLYIMSPVFSTSAISIISHQNIYRNPTHSFIAHQKEPISVAK